MNYGYIRVSTRERTPIPEQFPEVFDLWRSGELSARAAADRLGVSARTFTRWTADNPCSAAPKTEKTLRQKVHFLPCPECSESICKILPNPLCIFV